MCAVNSALILPDPYSILLGPRVCWFLCPLTSVQREHQEITSGNWKLPAGSEEVGGEGGREGAVTPHLTLRSFGLIAAASSPYGAHQIPLTPLPPPAPLSSCCGWSLGASSSFTDSLHSTQASENGIFVFINLFQLPLKQTIFPIRKDQLSRTIPQPYPNNSNH